MKEQVSIDEEFVEKVIDDVGMSPVAWDCVDPRKVCRSVVDVYLDSNEEIERLKRLDENVRRQILEKRDVLEVIDKNIPLYRMIEHDVELLESLYE